MRKAIIIAGGESKRLYPIRDKYLVPFFDESIFERQFSSFVSDDIDEYIVICGDENQKQLTDIVERLRDRFQIVIHRQTAPAKGMWNAIETGLTYVGDDDQVVVVSFGDVVGRYDYQQFHVQCADMPLIAAKQMDTYFPGGYVTVADDHVTGIIEKPEPGIEPSNMITIVLHYFPIARELKFVIGKNTEKEGGYEDSISKILAKTPGALYEISEWCPVKYPWNILEVWDMWKQHIEPYIDPSAEIHPSAIIEGDVHISAGVKVFENAVIKGPAYIGENAIVATNALVRDSHIGAKSVVGYITEIARSFIADHVWTHSNYVGDSVVDSNVSFGAGTVTGNLRLDEKEITALVHGKKVKTGRTKYGSTFGSGVRVGVQTSFMPGTYVGRDAFVGAGIVIARPIEEGKFVYGTCTLEEKENQQTVTKRDV